MFEHQPNLTDLRGIMLAGCMTLLAGCGGNDSSSNKTSTGGSPQALASVPANLAATAGNAQASLMWSASSAATSYHVKRATTSGGPYAQIGAPTSASYSDTSLINGTMYYYVVSAIDSAGESANSAQVSAAPEAPVAVPPVPTNLAATAGNAQASLTWSASSGATSYHVKRATANGGPYSQVAAPTSGSYSDTALTNGTTYYYVVSALDSAGESANSAQASAVPTAPVAVPPVPSGLAATSGNAQASLTWSGSSGATSYHVKRATASGGPYSQIAVPTSASYRDTSLTNGTTYYYVVSALDSAGESANSVQVSAMPVAPVSNPPPATFGTWINVTPSSVNLTINALDCANYGATTVQTDPMNPSNLYTVFYCQGIWKSTDYGATWNGPINTGTNGATVGDCAGGVTISPSSKATVPVIYAACIRGNGIGFWKSIDGGVNWTKYSVGPSSARQDYFPPAVDPYDENHLLMAGHEMESIVESVDGGQNWTNVSLDSGMQQAASNWGFYFINTGNASTTRGTWLWMAAPSGGAYGTWRTTNGGANWVQVDKNEHSYGGQQIYQPDISGVLYITGTNSTLGSGVLRSADYGQTWTHVGMSNVETSVIGTSKNVYVMYGYPASDPAFEIAAQPGTGNWVAPGTPAALVAGAAQLTVTNDGAHNILVGAMWEGGIWRYIEP